MCGRGAVTFSAERCRFIAGARARGPRTADRLRARYNLGPMGWVPVVTSGSAVHCDGGSGEQQVEKHCESAGTDCEREVHVMKWGLVPSFAKKKEEFDLFQGGPSTFNARVEGLEASGLWRRLVDKKRCVVLFDGFYEWKKVGSAKVPMYIRNADDYKGHAIPSTSSSQPRKGSPENQSQDDGPVLPLEGSANSQLIGIDAAGVPGDGPRHAPLLLAGLFDTWRPKGEKSNDAGVDEEDTLESATILTMDSDGTPIFPIHDRSPVFLTPELAADWLDPSKSFKDVIHPVLRGAREHAQKLLIYEVPPLVSNMRNDSADLIVPKKEYDSRQFSKGLGKFFVRKTQPQSDPPAVGSPLKRPAEGNEEAAPPPKAGKIVASQVSDVKDGNSRRPDASWNAVVDLSD